MADVEHFQVLDAVYPDGKRYRVKIFRDKSLGDHARHRRAVKKLARECAGIEWMSTAPGCASLVPQVLIRRELESDSGDGPPFFVTPFPQGAPLYGHFSELSEQRKVCPCPRRQRADVQTRRGLRRG